MYKDRQWELVLEFWFDQENKSKRFKKDDDFDKEIYDKFHHMWLDACEGLLSNWRKTIKGRLAEIIVLDQFSRNLCREKPDAFTQDKMALVLSQEAIKNPEFESLSQEEKKFIIMPFMHSESREIQKQSVELFEELGEEESIKYAYKHKEIIDKFGRYPHRNKAMNRKSTTEELEFLKEPGSSF